MEWRREKKEEKQEEALHTDLAGLNKQNMPSSYSLGPEDPQNDGLVPPKGSEILTPKEKGVFRFHVDSHLAAQAMGKPSASWV